MSLSSYAQTYAVLHDEAEPSASEAKVQGTFSSVVPEFACRLTSAAPGVGIPRAPVT